MQMRCTAILFVVALATATAIPTRSQSIMEHANDLLEGLSIVELDTSKKVKDNCTLLVNETACEASVQGTCIWCAKKGSKALGKCVNESKAGWLPLPFYTCKYPKEEEQWDFVSQKDISVVEVEKDGTEKVSETKEVTAEIEVGKTKVKDNCTLIKNETGCEASESGTCVWCSYKGSLTAGKCVNESKTGWLPIPIFKCKAPGDAGEDPFVPPPSTCKKLEDELACGSDPTCSWCTSPLMPIGMCLLSEPASDWLPSAMFTCKPSPKATQTVTITEQRTVEIKPTN